MNYSAARWSSYSWNRLNKVRREHSLPVFVNTPARSAIVWHSLRHGEAPTAKEYIAHCLFESVEQLEELLHKLLNEGGLVIQWGRKIKNKGNAVYPVKLLRS